MSGKDLLIDSGPLVALLNERNQHHAICLEQSKNLRGPFHTTWPVVTEAAHLLNDQVLNDQAGAVQKLLAWIRTGEIKLLQLTAEDVEGIGRILIRYSDQNFDFADATLKHLTDREGIMKVFTIDHRHFRVFRTKSHRPLSLVPTPL